MSAPIMTCPVDADEAAARYARGDAWPEGDAFEVHVLTCVDCQRRVRLAAGVIAAAPTIQRRSLPRWRRIAGPALAAALLLIVVWPRDPVRRLGRVGAQAGEFAPVRSVGADVADSGLVALSNGDARRAAAYLTRAFDAQPTPGVAFYLALAHLKSDAPSAALGALEAITEIDRTTFNGFTIDAQYLRAKAWLQLGDGAAALRALSAVHVQRDVGIAAGNTASMRRNAALADSIRRVLE